MPAHLSRRSKTEEQHRAQQRPPRERPPHGHLHLPAYAPLHSRQARQLQIPRQNHSLQPHGGCTEPLWPFQKTQRDLLRQLPVLATHRARHDRRDVPRGCQLPERHRPGQVSGRCCPGRDRPSRGLRDHATQGPALPARRGHQRGRASTPLPEGQHDRHLQLVTGPGQDEPRHIRVTRRARHRRADRERARHLQVRGSCVQHD